MTLAAAMVISLVLSLTLTPSLCARWLGPGNEHAPGRYQRFSRRVFEGLRARYARSLGWVPEGAAENTALGATGLGAFEAYIDARSDSDESTGEGPVFEARIGRQTVSWGEGRLLGARDWWQSGLALDAVRRQLTRILGSSDLPIVAGGR